MNAPAYERMPIMVRAHAVTRARKKSSGDEWWRELEPGPSQFTLIFDCETAIDAAQQLRVGAYQFRDGERLLEDGFFFDPESLTSAELDTLRAHARGTDSALRTVREFNEEVLLGLAYQRNAHIVGFNLPFDISRIALAHDSARRSMRGGFSFALSDDPQAPRLQVKHLSRTAALIRFAGTEGQRTKRSARRRSRRVPVRRGYFCDVRSLARALTGTPHTLASLADLLETPHRKTEGRHGEEIDDEYLAYLANDVQVTWECFCVLRRRYEGFGLSETGVANIYSEASVGKACLREMGVVPWRKQRGELAPTRVGAVMSTYFGGRSEVHIRREVRQVLYCDFLSMYPTVSALMGLWRCVIADGVTCEEATEEVGALADSLTLEDLGSKETWPRLSAICQIAPDDDVLPVRAAYDFGRESFSIALNHLTSEAALWYTLADVIGAKLRTGRTPRILRAWRFSPGPVQDDLRPIDILGNPEYRIDPARDDFARRLIDLRSEVRAKAKEAPDKGVRDRLLAEQQAMKIIANSTCYGIFVELNVQERAKRAEVTFCGCDETSRSVLLSSVEQEGRYFHPLLATLTTAAARLMLGIAESLAEREGIDWAFCDTDSMALACPPGMQSAEFIGRARRVQTWFERLSPYERRRDLFKLEDANFALGREGGVTSDLEPLYCFAVSAKRYALFNVDASGRPVLRKASAHGLGHLLAPYEPEDAPVSILEPRADLAEIGVQRWQHDLWYRIVLAALEGHPQQVDLAGLPGYESKAISRYAATTPRLGRWFRRYNVGRPYRSQVRPFGFLNAFLAKRRDHLRDGERAGGQPPRAVSPFDRDPVAALAMCFDRETGEAVSPERLRSYHDALAQYHLHPEAKFVGGDYTESGTLERRHIIAAYVEHIGKEANRWEEQFHLGEDPQAQIVYGQSERQQRRLERQVREAIRRRGVRRVAKESGLSVGLVSGIASGRRSLTPGSLRALSGPLEDL